MDPRIGWYPSELISDACNTWSNVWIISQMNSLNQQLNGTNSTPNLTHNNSSTSSSSTTNNNTVNTNRLNIDLNSIASTPNLCLNMNNTDTNDTTMILNSNHSHNNAITQTIINGLRSRKSNKASTFGFNFPENQRILDDPMSTPWMMMYSNNTKKIVQVQHVLPYLRHPRLPLIN